MGRPLGDGGREGRAMGHLSPGPSLSATGCVPSWKITAPLRATCSNHSLLPVPEMSSFPHPFRPGVGTAPLLSFGGVVNSSFKFCSPTTSFKRVSSKDPWTVLIAECHLCVETYGVTSQNSVYTWMLMPISRVVVRIKVMMDRKNLQLSHRLQAQI